MERLKALEAEADAIEQALAQAPRDVPDVHPNVATLYRRKVERLIEALNHPADCGEAAMALRAVIDKVVITPTGRRGEIDVRLFGDLETVLAWAQDRESVRHTRAKMAVSAVGGPASATPFGGSRALRTHSRDLLYC
jgi:hypothetical protein